MSYNMTNASWEEVDTIAPRGYHDTTVWDDVILLPDTIQGGTARPDKITLVGNIDAYGFNGASITEEMSSSFEMPHTYKVGTDLRPHIHWCPSNTNSGSVKWQLEVTTAGVGVAFPSTTTVTATQASDETDRAHQVIEFDVIDGTNINIGDITGFRLFRDPTDGADTYGSDAIFLSLGFHYEIDGDGSRQVFVK